MDKDDEVCKEAKKNPKVKPFVGEEFENEESVLLLNDGEEENDEEESLLTPPRKGGLAKKKRKSSLSVQWNDHNGNNLFEVLEFHPSYDHDENRLFEVLEFHPSDVSEDSDDSDSCLCVIM